MNTTVSINERACAVCKMTFAEASSTSPEDRLPCPHCGSTARMITVSAASSFTMASELSATVIPHQDLLIEEACELHAAGKHSLAVLVAHMACEVVTSRVIDAAFIKSAFSHMAEPMLDFLNGYNLANSRIRAFYASLTGDDVTQLPLWSKFQESARRRNKLLILVKSFPEKMGKYRWPQPESSLAT